MKKILVALIHNHNEERNSRIRPSIQRLVDRLQNDFEVDCREFSHQPELIPQPKAIAFCLEALHEVLDQRWRHYIDDRPKSILKIVRNLRKTAFRYIANTDGEADRRCRAGTIAAFVTNKHMKAWNTCLESEAEYLIVVEDDAVFRDDSIERIASLADFVSDVERPIYVDLAGGFPISTLKIGHLAQDRRGGLTRYRKLVTNTACAYLLNRKMIDRSMQFLLARPHFRLVAIDWLINWMFMELEKTGTHGACFHMDPPALQHGSFTGDFDAWER